MYGPMNLEVLKQRREEMLREAELHRLKKALRADRKRPEVSRWVSSVVWELMRVGGLLRKLFRALRRADQSGERS